jgi:hypothetical protein
MARAAEFNVWNPCHTILFHIPVTEGAVQFNGFFVVDMIEKDGLIHGYPTENWEDGIKKGFGLKPITMIPNYGKSKKGDTKNEEDESPFHIIYLYWINRPSVKKKSVGRPSMNE